MITNSRNPEAITNKWLTQKWFPHPGRIRIKLSSPVKDLGRFWDELVGALVDYNEQEKTSFHPSGKTEKYRTIKNWYIVPSYNMPTYQKATEDEKRKLRIEVPFDNITSVEQYD